MRAGAAVRGARAIRALLLLAIAAASIAPGHAMSTTPSHPAQPVQPIALAVLGDSNSHSYQDRISFPPGNEQRGGAWRAATLQWTEVLGRLRGGELDPGPWRVWGVSNPWLRGFDALGWPVGRAPRKEDYRYNFANDAAQCDELMGTRRRQVPRLIAEMDRDPARWREGVVVIRIGMGDLSSVELLDTQAHDADPQWPAVRRRVDHCIRRIGEAVARIQQAHPQTRIVLVGLFDDSNDAGNLDRWRSAVEVERIARMCDAFDQGLRRIAAARARVSFFDDRAWFRAHWGGRGPAGEPAYRTVALGAWLRVDNTKGDAPTNALLADGHAGLVWNALWAQALVAHLREAFSLPLTPIGDEELARWVAALFQSVGAVKAPGP